MRNARSCVVAARWRGGEERGELVRDLRLAAQGIARLLEELDVES